MARHPMNLLLAVAVIAGLAAVVPVRTDAIWIDPVTGSTELRRSWFGITTMRRVETSALERWVVAHEGQHEPRSRFLTAGDYTVYDDCQGRGCAPAPAVYLLRPGETGDRFVRHATDAEITALLDVLRTGNRAEMEKSVKATVARVLGRGE